MPGARARSFSGSRAAARRRRARLTLLAVLCTSIAVLVAGIWYVTRLPSLSIERVEVSGGLTVDEEVLRTRLTELLDGSYLFLVPRHFTLTYPHDALEAVLEEEPRIARAEVTRDGRVVSAVLTERIPAALWCSELGKPDGCVFLSADGEAFAPAPSLDGAVFRRYVIEGHAPEAGARYISPQRLSETETFAEALRRERSMRIRAVVETADGDLRYLLLGGGELIVAPRMPVEQVFENLGSVLDSEEFAHLAPGNFAYIDLRFGNKVFVNEEIGDTFEQATTTMSAAEVLGEE